MNNAKSAEEAAAELRKQGYATDPSYTQHLQRLLSEYSDVRPSQEERVASLEEKEKEKDESIAMGKPGKPPKDKAQFGKPGEPLGSIHQH